MKNVIIMLSIALFMICSRAQALPPEHSPDPKPGAVWVEPTTGMEFVWVPAGCFIMGTNSTKAPFDEKPAHKVCLDGFWMGRFEVTNAQFRKYNPKHDSGKYKGVSLNGDQQPVVNATWVEARRFARWLTVNNHEYFELPTEAQWEYAALAGAGAERYYGETYFGEESPCLYGNFVDHAYVQRWGGRVTVNCDDGHAATAPVGSYRPNPFGLYDMLGNALEMCLDEGLSSYLLHARRNPLAMPVAREERVERGSCFACGFGSLSSKGRLITTFNTSGPESGFRLIREK